MARGILATITAPTVAGNSAEEIRQVWLDAYADEPFVTVLPQGQWTATGMTLGSNTAALQVTVDPNAGRVVVVCAIDNLVKRSEERRGGKGRGGRQGGQECKRKGGRAMASERGRERGAGRRGEMAR